jgi:hypothetical protein
MNYSKILNEANKTHSTKSNDDFLSKYFSHLYNDGDEDIDYSAYNFNKREYTKYQNEADNSGIDFDKLARDAGKSSLKGLADYWRIDENYAKVMIYLFKKYPMVQGDYSVIDNSKVKNVAEGLSKAAYDGLIKRMVFLKSESLCALIDIPDMDAVAKLCKVSVSELKNALGYKFEDSVDIMCQYEIDEISDWDIGISCYFTDYFFGVDGVGNYEELSSNTTDWDSAAKQLNKFRHENFNSLADVASDSGRSEVTLRALLNAAIQYPGVCSEGRKHDKNNEKQILKGICKAVDLGYIRKVYNIGPIHGGNGGPSIPNIGIVDMDIDKVAKCCGMSEQSMEDAIGYSDPMPIDGDTVNFNAGLQIDEVYTLKDSIKSFFIHTLFGAEDDPEDVDSDIDGKIDDLKESIFKAKRTLARLQNLR